LIDEFCLSVEDFIFFRGLVHSVEKTPLCENYAQYSDMNIVALMRQRLSTGQAVEIVTNAERRAFISVGSTIPLQTVSESIVRSSTHTSDRNVYPLTPPSLSYFDPTVVHNRFSHKRILFVGVSPSILGATPIAMKGELENYDLAFVHNDLASLLSLKVNEIWASDALNCPGYLKTDDKFLHFVKWQKSSNVLYYEEIKVQPKFYLSSRFGGGQYQQDGPASQITSLLSDIKPDPLIVLPKKFEIATDSEDEIDLRFVAKKKQFLDPMSFPHFHAHVMLGSSFVLEKTPIEAAYNENWPGVNVGDDVYYNVLKNTNNYIGQTSASVLAKQNQFRMLCDAKHINRDKLVSMLGGSTKVKQEFKVLEGMLASTHLQDNRNHNQVVISKEKALVLVAAAETFRREFVPSKKRK